MPVVRFRSVWVAPVALSAALILVPANIVGAKGPQPRQLASQRVKQKISVDVEVKFVDDSVMKMKLLDDKLELSTRHGVLHVAVTDIRRIDFASRVSPAVAEKVTVAVSKLNNSDFRTREAATAELKAFRERAYPFALKALKSDDPEVSRRADEVVKYIQSHVPAAHLQTRESDVVQTDDSKITGRLSADMLRVNTFQFGEQQLKLADVRSLRSLTGSTTEATATVAQAPVNLSAYQQQWGKELTFAVTGYTPTPGANANLWGTDVYTLDSNLAAAAVHAGLARPGESAVLTVRIMHPPPQFVSTFRHNVNSTAYGAYPAGAYEFLRR